MTKLWTWKMASDVSSVVVVFVESDMTKLWTWKQPNAKLGRFPRLARVESDVTKLWTWKFRAPGRFWKRTSGRERRDEVVEMEGHDGGHVC